MRLWWPLHNSVNILKNNESSTFNRWIAWYLNYISIKLIKRKERISPVVQWLRISLTVQRTLVQTLVQENSTCVEQQACAPLLLRRHSRASRATAAAPTCLESVLCSKKPSRGEACTQTKSSPCSLQLEEAWAQQQRPSAAKIKGLFLKIKKKNSTYIYIYIYVENHHVLIVLLQQPSNPYPHIHPTTSVSKYQIMFYPQIFQYVLFIIYICIFGCAGPSLLHVLSSSCGEWGLLSVAQPTRYGGFSCYGARALGRTGTRGSAVVVPRLQSTGSLVVVHGLSCFLACRIFPDQDLNPCLLHWQAHSLPLSHQGSPSVCTSKG